MWYTIIRKRQEHKQRKGEKKMTKEEMLFNIMQKYGVDSEQFKNFKKCCEVSNSFLEKALLKKMYKLAMKC